MLHCCKGWATNGGSGALSVGIKTENNCPLYFFLNDLPKKYHQLSSRFGSRLMAYLHVRTQVCSGVSNSQRMKLQQTAAALACIDKLHNVYAGTNHWISAKPICVEYIVINKNSSTKKKHTWRLFPVCFPQPMTHLTNNPYPSCSHSRPPLFYSS